MKSLVSTQKLVMEMSKYTPLGLVGSLLLNKSQAGHGALNSFLSL